ncbi:hypothetical protein ACHAXS_002211 [Conticribra weissflogii]
MMTAVKIWISGYGFRDDPSVSVNSSTNSDAHFSRSKNDGINVGRRGFPNAFSSIKSFFMGHQRYGKKKRQKNGIDASSTHKVSIDHTVCSRGSNGRMNESSQLTDISSLEDVDNNNNIAAPSCKNILMSDNTSSFQGGSCLGEICHDIATHRENRVQNNFHFHKSTPTVAPDPHPSVPSADVALQARIEAVEIQQVLLGENHPDVIFALSRLAKLHQRRGDHSQASSIMRESQKRSFLAKNVPQHHHSVAVQAQNSIPREISFSP